MGHPSSDRASELPTHYTNVWLAILWLGIVGVVCGLPAGLAQSASAAPQSGPRAAAPAQGDLIDINTATAEQLKTLPGVGAAYASRIIAGRPYTAKNQLVSRGVIPLSAYNGIASQIIARHPK